MLVESIVKRRIALDSIVVSVTQLKKAPEYESRILGELHSLLSELYGVKTADKIIGFIRENIDKDMDYIITNVKKILRDKT